MNQNDVPGDRIEGGYFVLTGAPAVAITEILRAEGLGKALEFAQQLHETQQGRRVLLDQPAPVPQHGIPAVRQPARTALPSIMAAAPARVRRRRDPEPTYVVYTWNAEHKALDRGDETVAESVAIAMAKAANYRRVTFVDAQQQAHYALVPGDARLNDGWTAIRD